MPPAAAAFVSEPDVPSDFNSRIDEAGLPQRVLDDFTVTRAGRRVSICDLDDPAAVRQGAMHATGRLHAPSGESIRTESADLTEWCVEYSSQPVLWVRTATTWYQLGKPAAEYATVHSLARRRFEVCARLYILMTQMRPSEATFAAFSALLSSPWGEMKGYTEKEIILERSFILSQFQDLKGEEHVKESLFLKELRAKKGAVVKSGSKSGSGGGIGGGHAGKEGKSAGNKVAKKKSSASTGASGALPPTKPSGPWVPRTDLDSITAGKLLLRMSKVVSTVMKMKKASPFLTPVDPEVHGVPDYFDRVAQPMDYGTIWNRLKKGVHYRSVEGVVADVRLVRHNCATYNGKDHPFSKYADEVEKKFDREGRAAEEAEVKAMQKRLSTGGSGKKAGDSADSMLDGHVGPTGRKPPRSSASSVASDGDVVDCISTASGSLCGKRSRPGSRYCGDDCGMAVARKKLQVLKSEGLDIDGYIQTCLGKSLVGINPLNR